MLVFLQGTARGAEPSATGCLTPEKRDLQLSAEADKTALLG
jgi:hypothetical protein